MSSSIGTRYAHATQTYTYAKTSMPMEEEEKENKITTQKHNEKKTIDIKICKKKNASLSSYRECILCTDG